MYDLFQNLLEKKNERIFFLKCFFKTNNQFNTVRNGFKQFVSSLNDVYSSMFEFSKVYFDW
jgi:hypothetical protein